MRTLLCSLALVSSLVGAAVPEDSLNDLDWRLIGPFRAGWSTVAVGVPTEPGRYYFGAAGGGVWTSSDYGHNWQPIFDQGAPSIGALAVAHSNPKVLYVGTGQPQARYDVAAGNGVWRSDDAGQHWQHLGLTDTRHIGEIWVHPERPDTVLVAALGPYYADSPDRGVYRSTDGGRHWTHTLKLDAASGAVDLGADPTNPDIVFAATWTARNYPWMSYFTPMYGEGSGLYRSTDGGQHWTRVQGEGWPDGPLGRVGISVTHWQGQTRVYALIDHNVHGGLYRSDDGGQHWQVVQADPSLTTRYFARVTAHPTDPDQVFVMGRSMKVSKDAGKTLTIFRGSPGGDDYHDLWIDPSAPSRMIAASDQGTIVSTNGGQSWSDWYNQPTGQFYCLHVDQQFPYRLFAGQQDNGSVAIKSRSDFGAISFRDWMPAGADERDCVVPDPDDPNVLYGSGLGGRVSRFDARTGDVQNITPLLVNTYGRDPRTIDQRFSWITPLTISPVAPHALYLGSQSVYRSVDRGATWQPISADLTGRSETAETCQGDLPQSRARACGFGVIFNIAPSPLNADELWVGTDSGLIQRTRDGGKTWQNLTPGILPEWGLVARIDPSPLNAEHAYVAVDLHRMNRFEPMFLRTSDGGKTWTNISDGIPKNEFSAVIRADVKQPGLLYAGTDRSVYVSFDDGAHWQPLAQSLPVAWVRDLRVVGNDLAIATQGRALWILDNVERLRALAQSVPTSPTLFPVADTWRLRKSQNKDTPLAAEIPLGKNPPTGAIIEYYLPESGDALSLRVKDAAGTVIFERSSEATPEAVPAEQYFSDLYRKPEQALPNTRGSHRVIWNLRHPRPLATAYEYSIAATAGVETSALPEGPLALPGRYTVELLLAGKTERQSFEVKLDPRLNLAPAQLQHILDFNLELATVLKQLTSSIGKTEAALSALASRTDAAAETERAALQAQLDGDPKRRGLHSWMEVLSGMATDAESAEREPTAAQQQLLTQAKTAIAH
ncbi:hypothetical protein C7S18_12915 [Ahniella affigens]|uniref:Sortilin N-terminal domain-containing protein n=1 Tax=Ahniella affigens TaxID=2021234 RepID=A0A2P1PT69_9GAMM|nr:hypothetical protein [Ahniella affigens]AVP98045.1 hypothetical protein C7S18_12915 [Ahniella affigens]